MADEKQSGLDGLLGKAEDALGNFMDDPAKVDKAKVKAEELLGKHMDQEQADKLTNAAEDLLGKVAHRPSGSRDSQE